MPEGGCFACLSKKKKKKIPTSGRQHTWPVPYLSKLEGTELQSGQSIIIRGYIIAGNHFNIHLASGPKIEGENMDDIVLTLSNRLKEGKIVLNSYMENAWGKEERIKNPFEEGEEFDYRIRCHQDSFEIFANHTQIAKYPYRLPLSGISHIFVDGDVELYTVSWEGKYYSVPYEAGIPGNFFPGRKLYVSGEPEKSAKDFNVNLFAGADTAFTFSVRFNEKAVVRNTQNASQWGAEERAGEFPFDKKHSFDISIVCEDDAFKVYVDGEHFCDYRHRMSPRDIDRLSIVGNVELQGVHLK